VETVASGRAQVEKLRTCLEEARRRLGAQSRSLQQQWRRGVTLGDTVRLLSDINSIVDAPQRVQKLEEAKACSLTALLAKVIYWDLHVPLHLAYAIFPCYKYALSRV
jgi:hypothetical protein